MVIGTEAGVERNIDLQKTSEARAHIGDHVRDHLLETAEVALSVHALLLDAAIMIGHGLENRPRLKREGQHQKQNQVQQTPGNHPSMVTIWQSMKMMRMLLYER